MGRYSFTILLESSISRTGDWGQGLFPFPTSPRGHIQDSLRGIGVAFAYFCEGMSLLYVAFQVLIVLVLLRQLNAGPDFQLIILLFGC